MAYCLFLRLMRSMKELDMLNIEDAGLTETIARVCYRLIVLEYRRSPEEWPNGREGLRRMRAAYRGVECSWLHFWLLAYQHQVEQGLTVKQARDLFIGRSQAGYTWRAVAYPPYKAGRKHRG